MITVVLKRQPRTVDDQAVCLIRDNLRRIVLKSLRDPVYHPSRQLTEDDIDIDIVDDHRLSDNKRDYCIVVILDAETRLKNLPECAGEIGREVGEILTTTPCYLVGHFFINPSAAAGSEVRDTPISG